MKWSDVRLTILLIEEKSYSPMGLQSELNIFYISLNTLVESFL